MTNLKPKSESQLQHHNNKHTVPIHTQCPYCKEDMEKLIAHEGIDPVKIPDYTKEELVKFYNEVRDTLGVLEATRQEIGKEILSRMKTDGEVIGSYALTKAKRISFPDISLEQAKELGAVKTIVDMLLLKKLWLKGVKIKPKIIEYLIVKQIESKEE